MNRTEQTNREQKNPGRMLRGARRQTSAAALNRARKRAILGTLLALFDLARGNDPARAENIAGRLGLSTAAVEAALTHLERKGLVDADRTRLTLLGLSMAASLRTQEARLRDERSDDGARPGTALTQARRGVRAA